MTEEKFLQQLETRFNIHKSKRKERISFGIFVSILLVLELKERQMKKL